MVPEFKKDVPFDPGYSDIAFSFTNEINFLMQKFYTLKNPNQKRFELLKNEKSIVEIINKSTAFYLGCMLWGGYIHYRFKNEPKIINGNHIEKLTEQEKKEIDCANIVRIMINYIKNFDRDCKYYLKHQAKIEPKISEILEGYIEFAELNNNFLETKNTEDVKIPKVLDHFKNLSEQELDKLAENIYEIIEKKDIGKILDIGFFHTT